MGKPAAKQGDQITAKCTHTYTPPSPPPVTQTFSFVGIISGNLSTDVHINGKPAAMVDSTATNDPPHVAPAGVFTPPPSNQATIKMGSGTVMINGKAAARDGDKADTCGDPPNLLAGTVVAAGTVNIGG